MPRKGKVIALLGVALAAAALAIALLERPREMPPIAGMVRQTEIRIAPEITGRLTRIAVRPGQQVQKGDLLAALDNPELAGSLNESQMALVAARAERDRIYSGIRAEEVSILARSVQTAESNLRLAQQEIVRTTVLAKRDFATRQELDDRTAALAKTESDLALKRAEHASATAGPTAEEKALAEARVVLAEITVERLQARLGKTRLIAPMDGTVGVMVAERGEVVPVGKPVLMLEAAKPWFAFTLREDELGELRVGDRVGLLSPSSQKIEARLTELRPLGEFATWRAARATNDHDLNSFRLRFDAVGTIEDLKPGMTVWLDARSHR